MFGPYLYAVFGSPIIHSRSPDIHRAFATQCEQDLIYTKQEVRPEEFEHVCKEFFELGGSGLNITLPLKELAFRFADKLTARAQLAGAVNTLALTRDGTILGDNTDGAGLVWDITDNLGWSLTGKNILILGAGGAVRGVLGPLLEKRPASILIANRTAEKAYNLAAQFATIGNVQGTGYDNLPKYAFDVVINGTSLSLAGEIPPITVAQINKQTHCYDMAYSNKPTAFLAWLSECGLVHLSDGLGMLVEQAAESFKLWRGVMPNTHPVISQLRDEMMAVAD
jgi:shikimate dehydrogenase